MAPSRPGPEWRAVCAATGAVAGRRERIENEVLPLLAAAGYALPPSVALDLACLFLDGPDVGFQVPSNPPVPRELLEKYCGILAQAAGEGRFRRMINRARQVEQAEGGGLVTFLERMAACLPASAGQDGDRVQGLASFLRALERIEPGEVDGLLTLAAARVQGGAERLDLPLLQECLDYSPLELDGDQTRRHSRLQRHLAPREVRSARSPELGNHGITNRGQPTAVLRSFLARDHFVELLASKRVLYFDRFAPRQEARRVLLAWVVERGGLLRRRVRATGRRRESVALGLAAATLQDAVLWFAGHPALELEVAVLLHGGEESAPRGFALRLDRRLFAPLAARASREDAARKGWLHDTHGFLPHYFLREPVWPGDPGGPALPDPFQGLRAGGPRWQRALAALGRFAAPQSRLQADAATGQAFDLCHVTLCGAALPRSPGERDAALSRLAHLGGERSLCLVEVGEDRVTCTPWRPLRRPAGRRREDLDGVQARRACWEELCERLARL